MTNIVNPAVKFSYNIIKGSISERRRMIADYNKKIFNEVCEHIEDKKIYKGDLQKSIEKILPEKKKIEVLSAKKSNVVSGASDYIYGKKNEIIGQTIEMPMKSGKMAQTNIAVFMHELTHVMDALVNPKLTARTNRMYQHNLYTKEYDNLMFNTLYKYEKVNSSTPKKQKDEIIQKRKEQVLQFLKGKKTEDKIDYIQELKNSLLTEKNAFTEEHIYAKKLEKNNIKSDEDSLNDSRLGYMFNEKIQMLHEIGLDIIAKARKEFAQKLARKNKKKNKL